MELGREYYKNSKGQARVCQGSQDHLEIVQMSILLLGYLNFTQR